MKDFNIVVLSGRLTREPEVRYTQDNKAVSKFTLAVNGMNDDCNFLSCVAFGKAAEFTEKYFKKGTKANIRGHIKTGNYTKQDDTKVYTTDIVCDEVGFGEAKSESSPKSEPKTDDDGFMNIPGDIDEELPFAQPKR